MRDAAVQPAARIVSDGSRLVGVKLNLRTNVSP